MQTSVVIPVESVRAVSFDRLAGFLLFGQLVAATFLQKLAVTVGGDIQLFLGYILLVGLTVLGVVSGRLALVSGRCIWFLQAMAVMALVQLFHLEAISLPSLIMLMVVHLPYVFSLRSGSVQPGAGMHMYVRIMAFLAGLGFVQYVAQHIIGVPAAFPMEYYLPESLHVTGFNSLNPLSAGGDYYKSTGVFFLEPAIFCQFIAIAFVIEMVYFRNWKRLILYVLGIAVTFSGTGLIILFLLVPFYLLEKKQYVAMLLLAVVMITAPLWAPEVGLGMVVGRAGEFFDPNSSGFARFVSMFYVLRDFILPYPDKLIWGVGAGSIGATVPRAVDYANFDPTWGKLIYEYGIVASLFYFAFLTSLFTGARCSRYVKAALLIQYLVLGGYIIPPTIHGLIVALIAWPPKRNAEVSS